MSAGVGADVGNEEKQSHQQSVSALASSAPRERSWLSTPRPIKRLFSSFPLVTLSPNPLPARTLSRSLRGQHVLYIFTTTPAPFSSSSSPAFPHSARIPSFNPTCLKWQSYLLFLGVPFRAIASSNHASPSGALPFLLPATTTTTTMTRGKDREQQQQQTMGGAPSSAAAIALLPAPTPVTASKLQSWAEEWARETGRRYPRPHDEKLRLRAYLGLIEHRIRTAWLYTLYLIPTNFDRIVHPLYICPATSSAGAQVLIARSLRRAARAEVCRTYPSLDARHIFHAARDAFEALDALLREREGEGESGSSPWFFDAQEPGLLDAALFSYTCLILDDDGLLGWGGQWAGEENSRTDTSIGTSSGIRSGTRSSEDTGAQMLRRALKGCFALRDHCQAVRDRYFLLEKNKERS